MTFKPTPRREKTARKVLDTARMLFAERGFEAVSVRMIAEHAGVAVGSVFAMHASKEDILSDILQESLPEVHAIALAAVQEAGAAPVLDRVCAGFAPIFAYDFERVPLIVSALAYSWSRGIEAEQQCREALAPVLHLLAGLFDDAIEAGELSPAVETALLAEMTLHAYWALFRRVSYDGWTREAVEALFRRKVELLLGAAAPVGLAAAERQAANPVTRSA